MLPRRRNSLHSVKRPRLGERTMLACIGCKQKKLKCDGQSPKCQNCSRSGRECLVEDPATGLYRPRDYMQSLEARVAYLEGLLQKTRPDVALDHLVESEQERQATEAQPSTSAAPDEAHVEADDPADQLSADVALLCLSAAGKEPHYFGPSSAVSFSRIVSAAMKLPRKVGGSQNSVLMAENAAFSSARLFPISFPSPALGSTLSQAYFNNLHPQYPFLHRPTFEFWENECMKADAAGNLYAAGDIAMFFVWMVYATASLALGPAHYGTAESYYYMALEHQPAVLELDSIESIQSLLSCAVYSIRSPTGGSLWRISGVAIRYCVELGYHRSVNRYRKQSNPLVAEMSKRCFWVAYDIDRVASFILGRPVGIPDDCIDAEMPLDIDDENINTLGLLQDPRSSNSEPPTHMTGAIHIIKLRRLWSKIGNSIYPTITNTSIGQDVAQKPLIDKLAQELEEWHADIPLPPDISDTDPLSVFASREWFRLAYDHSILILYRYWITHVPPAGEEHGVEEALEICYHRARDLCLLYRRLFQSQSIQFTWGSLHILFLGGLTYLYCIWKSPRLRQSARKMEVINTCMACNTALVIIAERWSNAGAYRDIFELLSERTISLICGDEGKAAEVSMPTLNQGVANPEPAPLEDWIVGLDNSGFPMDSEWLVQELLQGMRNIQPGEQGFDVEQPPMNMQ
ncbi:fungal-specific transcription factor domain-containing protein [Dactylonectria macrodidyma]|uniref:Fungal-specific transcription factor domain-containing protein n=1 Tax=Dactylonectria macrodidyma TaxID=307937 RepID=A0A9P9IKU9_9HYPO|nr:fungal-specific transcription factor domain-containing protein [Dactylonectria macrodidyma]